MRSTSYAVSLLAAFSGLNGLANAQCLNEVAAYNPDVRTQSANSTWFLVPVPKAAVATALQQAFPLGNLSLLDVPSSDKTLFPHGFPEGMHPVLASIAYSDDIRQTITVPQQIDGALLGASVYATYVSQDGKKGALSAALNSYIAGEEGPLPQGLVPALASTLFFAGTPLRLGEFIPQAAPYESDAAGILQAAAKWAILPNVISGPSIYAEVVDFSFQTVKTSQYPVKTFKTLINQPIVLTTGQCQRNTYYFNNATALPALRKGQVTFGAGASGSSFTTSSLQEASPEGASGVYPNQWGYSACAQAVGNNPEDCQLAASTVDPASLQ